MKSKFPEQVHAHRLSKHAGFVLEFLRTPTESALILMRLVLTWLMILSALAGLNTRVLSADGSRVDVCSLLAESCCQVDPHGATAPEEHHGSGDECPPGHHHHACGCSHAIPLMVENDVVCHSGVPDSFLLVFRHEGEVPPEGPFLGSEKPPLI